MKRQKSKRKTASQILILAGLTIVIAAAAIELYNYPWRSIKGNEQDESSLPDPTPIVLEDKDRDVVVVVDTSLPMTAGTVGEPAESEILPGDENQSAAPVYVLTQTGILKIPKLSVSQNILEGSGYQMNYGVGHVTGTAGLGQAGNCCIAGHRPHPFRYLDTLVSGDSVIVKVGETVYTYTVYESFDVLPDETWVLGDVAGQDYVLTLITCTPYMVSSHRLIVRASLTDINGMSPADYYAASASPGGSNETEGPASDEATPEVTSEASEAPDVPEPGEPVAADENPQASITPDPSQETETDGSEAG
jgi:LPXTG-site transpeptidase (sortase) family protein